VRVSASTRPLGGADLEPSARLFEAVNRSARQADGTMGLGKVRSGSTIFVSVQRARWFDYPPALTADIAERYIAGPHPKRSE